jgi:hypothetical protein
MRMFIVIGTDPVNRTTVLRASIAAFTRDHALKLARKLPHRPGSKPVQYSVQLYDEKRHYPATV